MKWNNIVAKITPIRVDGGRTLLRIDMPVTISKKEDNNFHIYFDVFKGLKTFTQEEGQIDKAINEALVLFFTMAEKHGKGWQEELMSLGWQGKPSSIRFKSTDDRFRAGTQKKLEVAI